MKLANFYISESNLLSLRVAANASPADGFVETAVRNLLIRLPASALCEQYAGTTFMVPLAWQEAIMRVHLVHRFDHRTLPNDLGRSHVMRQHIPCEMQTADIA